MTVVDNFYFFIFLINIKISKRFVCWPNNKKIIHPLTPAVASASMLHHRPAGRSDKPQSCEAPTPPARTAHARCPPLASSRSTHTRARTPYTQHPAPSSLSPVRSAPHSCAAQELQSPHDGGTSQRQQRLIGPSSDGRTGGQAAHQWVRHSGLTSPLLSHPAIPCRLFFLLPFLLGSPAFPLRSRGSCSVVPAAILWGQDIAFH